MNHSMLGVSNQMEGFISIQRTKISRLQQWRIKLYLLGAGVVGVVVVVVVAAESKTVKALTLFILVSSADNLC